MLEAIERSFAQWKVSADLPDWLAATSVLDIVLVVFIFIALHMVYKLARSVEVSSSGKVSVKYHSPLTWPARYIEQVTKHQANYTPKQRNILSGLYRGRNMMEALLAFLFGLLLFSMGAFLVYMKPESIFERYPAGFIIVGLISLAYAGWRVAKSDSGNPFKPDNDN